MYGLCETFRSLTFPMSVYNCTYPFSFLMGIETYALLVILIFALFLYSYHRSGVYRPNKKISLMGVMLIVVGGSYNLANRYIHGCVEDPLSFFGFFAFNYADIFINLGVVCFIYAYVRYFISKRKQQI